VLNWHGTGSNGPAQAAFTGYEALAEVEEFLVVHPTGVPMPSAGNTWELADHRDPGRDDLAFATTLIDMVVEDWCGDPTRIYSTGFSTGGYFTARLICEIADRIAAASSIAGISHPDDCRPARPVPFLAVHGSADASIPIDGRGNPARTADDPWLQALFAEVIPEEFGEFAQDANCSPEPSTTSIGVDVIRYDYQGCDDGTPMTFYEIIGGGHTWPSTPFAEQLATSLGYTTFELDATADSWAFFRQHQLDD
jgi:polyhydroxybutyrate depolymerase